MTGKLTKEELKQYFEFCLKFRRLSEEKKKEIYFVTEGAKIAAKYAANA